MTFENSDCLQGHTIAVTRKRTSNLGNALIQTRRASGAIDHFRQALRMTPDSASVHNNLEPPLAQIGRAPEAIAEFKAALRIDPGYMDARNNLAKLEATQKQNR